jgi:membrane protein DedA with SNARE-associated domain
MDATWFDAIATSVWLLPVLFVLVVGDAFFVILPSETVVVALGALWAATGHPAIGAVIPVAAVGAVLGDLSCYAIGRRVGLDRWRWQRGKRVAAAIERARRGLLRRPAVLVLTARYVPFARIAVNLAAGASGLPLRRFLTLSSIAGTTWALYNVAMGAVFGTVWAKSPLIAVAVSIVVAVVLGAVIDLVSARLASRGAPPIPQPEA